jgi:hypothetical protein
MTNGECWEKPTEKAIQKWFNHGNVHENVDLMMP